MLLKKGDKVVVTRDKEVLETEGSSSYFAGQEGVIYSDRETTDSGVIRVAFDRDIETHRLMRWMTEVFPIWTPEVSKQVLFSSNKNTLKEHGIEEDPGDVGIIRIVSRWTGSDFNLSVLGPKNMSSSWQGKYLLHFFPLEEYHNSSNSIARATLNPGAYCSCSSPNLVQSFTGLSGGGNMFTYCRVCGKEKL